MTYEETPITKRVVSQLPKPKTPIKKEKIDMNKEQYKKAKADHNAEIAKLKQDIQRHKLLKKQAKLTYKISKMAKSK